MDDLEEAIAVVRQAVALTSEDHPDRAGHLSDLGKKLWSRYERTGEMDDLEEAIAVARQAVALAPEDHPDCAGWLINLGPKLQRRYERTGETTDLEGASSCLQAAWNCQIAIPFHRVIPAAHNLKLLAIQRKVDDGVSLGKDIINFLPAVNTTALDQNDQQYVMSTFAGVAADLCALLLESGRPEEALEYLEKGRAVIVGRLMDNLSDLPQEYRDVASRYNTLLTERRREAVEQLEASIEEIRTISGFKHFLRSQTTVEMQESAAGGCIVVVNSTDFRSDAIIIFPTGIKSVALPKQFASDAKGWLGKEWKAKRSERGIKNKEYLQYLSWLWRVCVEQILEEVHAVCKPSEHHPPRVWWIGAGLASSMPFHATGTYSAGSAKNAYSKATSSYTPSIKALAHSRNRGKRTATVLGSFLMATMATTPGQRPLQGVSQERDKVLDAARGLLDPVTLDRPDVDRVVEGLQRCSIAHFACHGSTDHSDPSKSSLIFQKTDTEEDRLTIYMLSELNLTNVRLAFLFACSTAENRVARLTDEVIHVVSGFQVAGFPHVVGCLWPSVDRVCVEVAKEFYSSLFRHWGSHWNDGDVAWALREAVIREIMTAPGSPLDWAQFVHYGA